MIHAVDDGLVEVVDQLHEMFVVFVDFRDADAHLVMPDNIPDMLSFYGCHVFSVIDINPVI